MIPALVLALGLTGCSTMYARTPTLMMYCGALGQAKTEICAPGPVGDLGPEPPVCMGCEGGKISFAESLIAAAMAWVTGGMLGL